MRRKGGKEKRREDGGDGGEEEAAHWTGRGWAEQPQSRTSSLQEAPGGLSEEAQGAQEPIHLWKTKQSNQKAK